jgi:hypothetical protein
VRQCGADRPDGPVEVDVDHLANVLERRLEERVVRANAGVGKDDVEPPKAVDRRGNRRLHLFELAHVATEADRVRQAEVVAAARRETDLDALPGERPRYLPADAAARTGDEGHLAVE